MPERADPAERDGLRLNQPLQLSDLPVVTDDAELSAHWQEGLAVWGAAFVAFARVHPEAMESVDVLELFSRSFVATYESMAACVQEQIIDLNWGAALAAFRDIEGIPDDMLTWNTRALEALIRDVYDVELVGGKVHLFDK